MSALQELSFDETVDPRSAKHDKITLVISHRVYDGTVEDLDSFRHYLGAVPQNYAADLAGESFSQLFNRPGVRQDFKIRESHQGGAPLLPLPLFRGSYRLGHYRGQSDDVASVSSTLTLFLNPTRFLRHQDTAHYFPPRLNFTHLSRTLSSPAFFGERSADTEGEISLDGRDNWLPDTGAFGYAHEGALWSRNMRNYLDGVLREIEADTSRAAALTVDWRESDQLRPYSLREVETYFEFRSTHPLKAVEELCPLLHSFNELTSSVVSYPVSFTELREKNSLVFTKQIRSGVSLRIYAKTNRRVRFEVIHDLGESGLRISTPDSGKVRERHTFPNLHGVYRLLGKLRYDAAEVVNDALTHLRNRASIPATNKTSIDLLFEMARAVGNRETAKTLIYGLCSKGSISSLPKYRVALSKLVRAGILETQQRNRHQEYVVTKAYRFPLQMLRLHGNVTHLTTRNRTRGSS